MQQIPIINESDKGLNLVHDKRIKPIMYKSHRTIGTAFNRQPGRRLSGCKQKGNYLGIQRTLVKIR